MTMGRASGIAAGLVAAMGLGIWIAPHVTGHGHAKTAAVSTAAPSEGLAPTSARPHIPATVRRARHASAPAPRVAASTPALHTRLKPLLNKGADLSIAAQGFRSGEQFAAVAHAARNTDVPFMVLKHRVVNEHQSLAKAIHASRPEVNATVEAVRAVAEARSDIAALAS